jgi:hypothetical protein
VQFFTWLLEKERLPTENNLIKKGIVSVDTCDIRANASKNASHFCLHCPFVQNF